MAAVSGGNDIADDESCTTCLLDMTFASTNGKHNGNVTCIFCAVTFCSFLGQHADAGVQSRLLLLKWSGIAVHTLGIQEKAMKVCSRQVKPPLNKTRKAAGRRVPIMPATSITVPTDTLHACNPEEYLLVCKLARQAALTQL